MARRTPGHNNPMRIVSLLPSATEIICALGLQSELVGVTHECDYPPAVKRLPRVTKTLIPHDAASAEIDALVRERLTTQLALYTLDMPVLEALKPDLLVTQALCDVCAVAQEEVTEAACRLPGRPKVINLEPMSLDDVFLTMTMVGEAADRREMAQECVERLKARVDEVRKRTANVGPAARPRVVFLEWIDPPFSPGHWNPELIELAGGVCAVGTANRPSRTLDWQEVVDARPDVLFISCCCFDAKRALQDIPILTAQPGFHDLLAARTGRVYITDGNAYFSRPGPRLVDSLEILAHALHPDVHPAPVGARSAELCHFDRPQ